MTLRNLATVLCFAIQTKLLLNPSASTDDEVLPDFGLLLKELYVILGEHSFFIFAHRGTLFFFVVVVLRDDF